MNNDYLILFQIMCRHYNTPYKYYTFCYSYNTWYEYSKINDKLYRALNELDGNLHKQLEFNMSEHEMLDFVYEIVKIKKYPQIQEYLLILFYALCVRCNEFKKKREYFWLMNSELRIHFGEIMVNNLNYDMFEFCDAYYKKLVENSTNPNILKEIYEVYCETGNREMFHRSFPDKQFKPLKMLF
jgi:hypothetical protein